VLFRRTTNQTNLSLRPPCIQRLVCCFSNVLWLPQLQPVCDLVMSGKTTLCSYLRNDIGDVLFTTRYVVFFIATTSSAFSSRHPRSSCSHTLTFYRSLCVSSSVGWLMFCSTCFMCGFTGSMRMFHTRRDSICPLGWGSHLPFSFYRRKSLSFCFMLNSWSKLAGLSYTFMCMRSLPGKGGGCSPGRRHPET